jgi:serpin B
MRVVRFCVLCAVLTQMEPPFNGCSGADAVLQNGNRVEDVSKMVEGSNQFALDLYQQLHSSEGNLFFSPSSISTALSLTHAGAAGETKTEMAKTLRIQLPDDRLHSAMGILQASWKLPAQNKGIRLNIANRLWGQANTEFLPAFLAITRDQYSAELARLNFTDSESARQTINRWVEEQTQSKITALIPAGALASDTKLVLTNAVYFYGTWEAPFKKENTKDEDFYLTETEKVKVPLMHRRSGFRYQAFDDFQVLELPYGDGTLSMVALLPKEKNGLSDLESKLTYQNWKQWTSSIPREIDVQVYLPRFKTTSQFEMNQTLAAMGMASAFDPNTADFSGMTGGRDLFISKVVHKAFVDVNEEGTEAAAATGIVMMPTSALIEEPKEPPVFRADHPFLFMIRDNRNDAILFTGRIVNPLK